MTTGTEPARTVATTLEAEARPGACFLCAYADHPCEVASVEGWLRRVEPAGGRDRRPAVLLAEADGAEYAVLLPERLRAFVASLAALPHETLRRLRLRVFHLLPLAAGAQPDGETNTSKRRNLQTTPASVAVLDPDLLLNITDINNAEYCVRQYPLRRMIPSAPNAATLRGSLIHAVFKEMLKSEDQDAGQTGASAVQRRLERALATQATDLALRGLGYDAMIAEAEPHLEALARWRDSTRATLWNRERAIRAETFLLAPEVGLKGRLDFYLGDDLGGSLLELKTGRATTSLPKREHRWQVYGYQTLLAARRPHATRRPGATLLYSGVPGVAEGYGIPFALRELHRVLELRNALALVHSTGVTPPPPRASTCARCMLRQECARASSLLAWEPPASDDAAADDPPRSTPGPTDDARAFARLYELLRLEAQAADDDARLLWLATPDERRRAGLALGGLRLEREPEPTASGEWEYTFGCDNVSELREGDSILLSDGDPVRGAVVTGTILRLEERRVTVWTPERIANPTLLDRYESDIVQNRTLRNLWRWLEADTRLRELALGLRAPTFAEEPALADLAATFNEEQRAAIARALAAEDYALIQGPPGTGKTKVVAEIARRAMARGERVLLAAFTNQAVDTMLARVLDGGAGEVVRLGHEQSVAPELRPYRLKDRAQQAVGEGQALTPEVLRETLSRARLVAATTATWSAERFDDAGEPLRFDLAIVDEASQLTVPALLGALRFARRFALVGDERQLPPLVRSAEAAAQGLKRSLFEQLLARWGDVASVALRKQYRMHPLICAFPSAAFYGGALVAAGAARTATLDLALEPVGSLAPMLDPARPLVFVDVAAGAEAEAGKVSQAQARVVATLVVAFRAAGLDAGAIGVIAPFRAQVAAIRQRLAARGEPEVVVDTVDRFQGAERQVILFSFGGRAGEATRGHGPDFLADPQRLNVALTRAQRKLILVGSRPALEAHPLLRRLIAYCASLYEGRGGIVTAR